MNYPVPHLDGVYYAQHQKHFSSDYVFDERTTKTYELVYFLDDSNCKMILDGHTYTIEGHNIVFRKPGMRNQSFMPYNSILLCFTFQDSIIGKVPAQDPLINLVEQQSCASLPILDQLPVLTKDLTAMDYRKAFENIYNESLHNNYASPYYFTAKLLEILHGLNKEIIMTKGLTNKNVHHPITLQGVTYIKNHIQDNLDVPTICEALNISQRQLFKLFKNELHCTPVAYITEQRLHYAKQLLKHSNLTVEAIAEKSGYKNTPYFITLFKKKTGLTPGSYRHNNESGYMFNK